MGVFEKPNNLCLSIITCLNTFKQGIMKLLRDKNVFMFYLEMKFMIYLDLSYGDTCVTTTTDIKSVFFNS